MTGTDYEKDLNEEQFAAVTAPDGPVLVIAGAGSGKTRVVTYRVAWLIESCVEPSAILLVTFTNKAAREMLGRVDRLVSKKKTLPSPPFTKGGLGGILLKGGEGGIWGGTFHHVANQILRQHADLLGYERNYTILDRDDALQVMKGCVAGGSGRREEEGFPKPAVLTAVVGFAANTGMDVETVLEERFPYLVEFTEDISGIAEKYQAKKRGLNSMDFDDLLVNCHRLISENKPVREKFARKFKHILVDEYQDTNVLQADIVDMLAREHRCVTVVGDDAQSIYSFRGAVLANILGFPERYPDARSFHLETNYRSVPAILRAANNSISRNIDQFAKRLRAVRSGDFVPAVVGVRDVYRQAEFVAERIARSVDEGVAPGETAVLYRAHYHSMVLQTELARRGIPFEVRGGPKFFEQAHVKDVISYLRIVENPRDETSWKRVLRLYPGVGRATADRIWRAVSSSDDPLKEALSKNLRAELPKRAAEGLSALAAVLKVLAAARGEGTPADLIELVLENGYGDYMRSSFPDYADRLQDLEQFESFATRYADAGEMLSEIALLTDAAEPGREDSIGDGRRVVLSTIHQAKGLEWRVVFIIWLVDGRMPSARALPEEGGEEEERRLFYVAMTRAKDELYMTCPAVSTSRDGYGMTHTPSRFLTELDADTYEQYGSALEAWEF